MKKLSVKIPKALVVRATSLVKKPGVSVKGKNIIVTREKKTAVSPTFLFGKWEKLNMDVKELRKTAWDRATKY